MCSFDHGPVEILVHSDKVLSALIAEKVCTDALERVFWCLDGLRWCIVCGVSYFMYVLYSFYASLSCNSMPHSGWSALHGVNPNFKKFLWQSAQRFLQTCSAGVMPARTMWTLFVKAWDQHMLLKQESITSQKLGS